ncbi:MAG: arginyl-tRNA synthetase [Clostridia bacterium]|jgi:arginyl-tRNA synthetase|nr:arginyl-tRNA synthetase [Clostridia bacterium]MDN5322083.1 arginyl-tRNA synthetase [Clostridia bacterium]
MNIVEKLKNKIREQIIEALENNKAEGKIKYEEIPGFIIEVPREKAHGDFATNIAMLMAKEAKMNPRQIAQLIVDKFEKEGTWAEKIEIAGPGFINFYLNPHWLFEVLPLVEKEDENYGASEVGKDIKVQVEFVSANPTGLLHMGNARGAALGDTLANLLTKAGYSVTREFYINDAGNQIENFGKSLEARYFQELGHDFPFPEEGYHGQDVIDTVRRIINDKGEAYLKLDQEERRQKLVEIALKEKITAIRNALKEFGVEYDVWFSESTLHESGAIEEVIQLLKEKDLIYEQEGALWFRSSRFGPEDKDEVVVRSNGTPTYFAADIAYHKNKFDRGFDWVINIWGADHHGHVARMKGAVEAVGYNPDNLTVILMQLVRLFRGGEIVRMSKRTGKYVTLTELVEEVGKDAARYFFVMRNPDSHLDFDLDLAKQDSAENPVYYVQYAHARICSILKAAGENLPRAVNVNLKLLNETAEIELIRKIADLPDEIAQAAKALEPHRIARYAHDLASTFHTFYNSCRVLTDEQELKYARLVLVNATRITLRNVLNLLGVSAPERM